MILIHEFMPFMTAYQNLIQRLNRHDANQCHLGMITLASTRRPMRGVLLILAAVFLFACMDTTGKYLAGRYPVPFFAAMRYTVNLILLVAIFAPKHGGELLRIERKVLVLLRGAALATSSLFAGLALREMPLAETVAIIYLAPFGVLLLSGPLLKEPVQLSSWIATAIGFLGLILIVRPGGGLAPIGIFYGLMTIAGTITYHMLSRGLAKTENTLGLLFYSALVGTIFFGAMLPWNLPQAVPGPLDMVLLLALGALAMLGHLLFTAAYREAPVSLLTPVNYMHLAWAAVLGWLVFDHVPDAISIVGIALVAVAGAGNALWNHFSNSSTLTAIEPEEV